MQPNYDDDYSACSDTYSTLRIYHDDIPPCEVTDKLGIKPSFEFTKGQKRERVKRVPKINCWFLSSEEAITSFDSRRHLDYILDQLISKCEVIEQMQEEGYKIDITTFWVSTSANGGPTLSPYQMKRLSKLEIEIWWDIYFSDEDSTNHKNGEQIAVANPRRRIFC